MEEKLLEEIKSKMKAYRDFYGGDLISSSEIEDCKTEKDLCKLIDLHASFLENQYTDALSHLDRFRQTLGISEYN